MAMYLAMGTDIWPVVEVSGPEDPSTTGSQDAEELALRLKSIQSSKGSMRSRYDSHSSCSSRAVSAAIKNKQTVARLRL
eukprot:1076631-Amphidinium_carterae.1